jgi:hypothetical protein
MRGTTKLGAGVIAVILVGYAAYAAGQHRRHVMPEVLVDVRGAGHGDQLLLIYGEQGSDPVRNGFLGRDQRISQCGVVGTRCASVAAREEWGAIGERLQSLQVRLLDGRGNPVVGGVRWTGSWHPRQVHVACDPGIHDARRACTIVDVKTSSRSAIVTV